MHKDSITAIFCKENFIGKLSKLQKNLDNGCMVSIGILPDKFGIVDTGRYMSDVHTCIDNITDPYCTIQVTHTHFNQLLLRSVKYMRILCYYLNCIMLTLKVLESYFSFYF